MQDRVIDFLADPTAHAHAGTVTRIDTQLSVVFLVGSTAFKLKRAIHSDLVDYSTPQRRHDACIAEVRLNRPAASGLYRGVRAVTVDSAGHLAIDGAGEAVDHLVEMVRFDQDDLFDRMAEQGRLTGSHVGELAERVAELHGSAEPAGSEGAGGRMLELVDMELALFRAVTSTLLDGPVRLDLVESLRSTFADHAALLEHRGRAGCVRRCHGDLHLGNVCMFQGRPTPFDAIEFNDALTVIDVLYDIAFLLMDLRHRGRDELASTALDRYVGRTADPSGLALLPAFMSLRALVRSRVSAASAMHATGAQRDRLRSDARRFATTARRELAFGT